MSEHTGFFYWTPSVDDKHPGHGLILGDEDDPATSQPFIMAVMVPPTEVDAEIDLTVEHEATPVTYTQQKLPGLPAYFAKTVAATTRATKSTLVPANDVTEVFELAGSRGGNDVPESALTDNASGTMNGHIVRMLNTPELKLGTIHADLAPSGSFLAFTPDDVANGVSFDSFRDGAPVRYELHDDEPKNVRPA